MSWFRDPDLFIDYLTGGIRLWRLQKKCYSPLIASDFTFVGNVTNHLSLVGNSFSWNKRDFDALAAFLYRHDIVVNCHGVVITVTYPRDRCRSYHPTQDHSQAIYFLSHDVLNMPRYGLPVPSVPFRVVNYIEGGSAPGASISTYENHFRLKLQECNDARDREKAERQNLERKISELKLTNASLKDDLESERNDKKSIIKERDQEKAEKKNLKEKNSDLQAMNGTLQEQLNREKKNKQALEKDVFDLKSKLKECCAAAAGGNGSAKKESWMSNSAVSSEWVCFEDLDVQNFTRNSTLTVTKDSAGAPEDISTNVGANNFYRGITDAGSVVLVNVGELNPNKEKARFDPSIWGLFKIAGTTYAARKPAS